MKGWVQYDTPFLPGLIVYIGNQACAKKSMTDKIYETFNEFEVCLNFIVLI